MDLKQRIPIDVRKDERGVCTITLNRPQKHNAFDGETIHALLHELQQLNQANDVRLLVLTGTGASFSSGADLQWMKSMANYDLATNRQDAQQLADLMRALYTLNKPSIARVNGAAFGGGIGLIACCDIAVSVDSAKFAFTEVKLGLVPAVISPYISAAIGRRQAQRLFLTAEIFSAQTACQLGLVSHCVADAALDETVEQQIACLLKGGPQAQYRCKALLAHQHDMAPAVEHECVECIAAVRVSPEGQEGLNAFLNKRQPSWLN